MVLAAAITLVMIAVGMYAVVGGDSAGPTPGSSKADVTTGPPQSAAGEASPRRRNAPRDVPRKLVQPAWSIADMASLPRSDVPLSALVDIEDAVGAPSLLDAPIPRAVMVLSEDISFDRESAFPDGELAILGRGGAWRELSTEDLGLLDNTNEVPFSLSRDGALLAVGDRGAVVTIDVATGEQQRFRVPFRKPIGLEWTDNNHKLHVSDRWTRTERPLLLDVRTGATTPVDYSIFTTGFDSGGTPVDVKVRAEPRKAPTPLGQADILTYPGPTRSQKTPIRVGGI